VAKGKCGWDYLSHCFFLTASQCMHGEGLFFMEHFKPCLIPEKQLLRVIL
jgi:hypothetical protein